jgi:hypothetical protein
MPLDSALVATGIQALIERPVTTDAKDPRGAEPGTLKVLHLNAFHKMSLVAPALTLQSSEPISLPIETMHISILSMTGKQFTLKVESNDTIACMKTN